MRLCSLIILFTLVLLTAASTVAQAPKAKVDPKAKTDPKGKVDPKGKGEEESKFNLKVLAKDIQPGTHIMGPKLGKDDTKGRVVQLTYWGYKEGRCLSALPGMIATHKDLEDFGLLMMISNLTQGMPNEVRTASAAKNIPFTVAIQAGPRLAEQVRVPHGMVFGHKGECIFRSDDPKEVETAVRKAVGEALLAGTGKDKLSPVLDPVVKDLKAGKPPTPLLAKVAAIANGKSDAADDAKALLTSMTAFAQKRLTEYESKDPIEAFDVAEQMAVSMKGTPVGAKATELLAKLRKEKAVQAELAARKAIDAVRQMDVQLSGMKGSEDPKKPEFQKGNALTLKQLRSKVQSMKAAWPKAPSTKEAVEIAEKFGIEFK